MTPDQERWAEALAIAATFRVHTRLPRQGYDEGWYAYVAELPGCDVKASTHVKVLTAIREAAAEWIEERLRLGLPIPTPEQRSNGSAS